MKFNKTYLLIVVLLFVILFRIDNKDIFYEHWFNIEFILFIIIVLIMILFFSLKKVFKKMYLLESVATILISAYLFSLIILFPLNYYNKRHYIKSKAAFYEICEIIGVSKSRKTRGYHFTFKKSSHLVPGRSKDLYKIENNPNKYLVSVKYKKGLFNSYVFISKKLIDKQE